MDNVREFTELMQKWRMRRFTRKNGFPEKALEINLTGKLEYVADIEKRRTLEHQAQIALFVEDFPKNWILTDKGKFPLNYGAAKINLENEREAMIFRLVSEIFGKETGYLDLSLTGKVKNEDFEILRDNYPVFDTNSNGEAKLRYVLDLPDKKLKIPYGAEIDAYQQVYSRILGIPESH